MRDKINCVSYTLILPNLASVLTKSQLSEVRKSLMEQALSKSNTFALFVLGIRPSLYVSCYGAAWERASSCSSHEGELNSGVTLENGESI